MTWPTLPEFGQRALNAANAVASDATEWEVAITMSETYENMIDPNWELAMQAALSSNPSCELYGDSIQQLVEKFSGGSGAPLIHEQDAFVKTMGENRRLGETFSRAIVKATFGEHKPVRSCAARAHRKQPDVPQSRGWRCEVPHQRRHQCINK